MQRTTKAAGRLPAALLISAIVLAVATLGVVVKAQGWRSRTPTMDSLGYIDGAQQLLTSGIWPDRGILTSFGSYTPPGTTWLMLPGVFLFDDPRLYEFPGSAVLYLGTLLGIFLLARFYFGTECAVVAVIIYGVSTLGLNTADSLWPRFPLPFFYVWMVYCASRWVARRNSNYLAAALILWAVGMYVFLEIAPAIFILPIVWVLYRPPVSSKPLLIAGIVALVVWFPYIRLESGRNFVDVNSQVRRTVIVPADYKKTWCNPQLVLRSLDEAPNGTSSNETLSGTASNAAAAAPSGWFGKFEHAAMGNFSSNGSVPASAIILMSLVLISSFLFAFSGPAVTRPGPERRVFLAYWLPRLALALIGFGVLANEFIVSRYLSHDGILAPSTIQAIRLLQTIFILSGTALLLRRRLRLVVDRLAITVFERIGRGSGRLTRVLDRAVATVEAIRGRNARLIVVSMGIPWAILFLVIEDAGRVDRLWWIWPLHAIILASSVLYIPALFGAPRLAGYAAAILLVLMVVDPRIGSRAEAWVKVGWSGTDDEKVRLVDYVVSQLGSKRHAAIGYQEYNWRFLAEFNVMDPRYKVGAEFDTLFKNLYGVSNTNTCAEGVSPADEFRIVQTRHHWTDPTAKGYIDIPSDPQFTLVQQVGSYKVLRRF